MCPWLLGTSPVLVLFDNTVLVSTLASLGCLFFLGIGALVEDLLDKKAQVLNFSASLKKATVDQRLGPYQNGKNQIKRPKYKKGRMSERQKIETLKCRKIKMLKSHNAVNYKRRKINDVLCHFHFVCFTPKHFSLTRAFLSLSIKTPVSM